MLDIHICKLYGLSKIETSRISAGCNPPRLGSEHAWLLLQGVLLAFTGDDVIVVVVAAVFFLFKG